MIDRTDLDLKCAAHAARTAKLDREGWQRVAPTPASRPRTGPDMAPIARLGWLLAATRKAMRADQQAA